MSKANLVIVESPAKAKTIAGYLGGDFEVKSSYGHIRDLPKKQLGVDIDKDFAPTYVISPDKTKVARELKAAAKGKTVWLASDEDREGEAIAWHVCYVLGLNPAAANRIVFHEITKPAIAAAMAAPRHVDAKLVDAQQARRVLDRLVGYELSPILWRKIRTGLSAGRVQSVAVRLVVEREREIRAFTSSSSFKLTAVFNSDGQQLPAELAEKLADRAAAEQFLSAARSASFSVASLEQKPASRSPGPPFTTSTLQQEAARRLGYSVKQTMSVAQRLYEAGLITYMRTDSLNLSPLAIKAAGQFITSSYGANYPHPRQFKTKNKLSQEAHEAIRPTNLSRQSAGADAQQQKLYELIWRRTLASQMAPAEVDKTEARIALSNRSEQLLAVGEVLKFDGFLKVYGGGKEDRILPPLKVGQPLQLKSMTAVEVYARAPARYSEASLVRKLEELGIGRPSTYAPTISTIQDRGYVEKTDVIGEARPARELTLAAGQIKASSGEVMVDADRAKLLPTQLADIVTDFLVKHFTKIVDYDFTAKAEDEFDAIAAGRTDWRVMLKEFYDGFHPQIEAAGQLSRAETLQVRQLGVDPKSGQKIYARYGRYGAVLQLGESPDKKDKAAPKPKFAPLPTGAELDSVTLEQALPMFDLPRVVGQTASGEEITANIGRFGPYIKIGKQFISLKEADPLTVSQAQARQIITEHQAAAAKKLIVDFGDLKILNGPYGPYVSDGKKNVRIPKKTDPASLGEAQARELLANYRPRPRRRK